MLVIFAFSECVFTLEFIALMTITMSLIKRIPEPYGTQKDFRAL